MKKIRFITLVLVAIAFLSGNAIAGSLVDKLYRLGYTQTESLALAQKVEQGNFISVKIGSGIEVLGVFKGDLYGGKQVLVWSENPGYVFQGEDYGSGLWRFMNNGAGVLLRVAIGSRVSENNISSSSVIEKKLTPPNSNVAGGRSLDASLSLRPEKTGEGTEIVHDPQAGILAGANKDSGWAAGYIRYKADIDNGSDFVPGVGFLGEYALGYYPSIVKGKDVQTDYRQGAIGPMIGFKAFGDTTMTEVDLALQYYWLEAERGGKNIKSKDGLRLYGRIDTQKKVTEDFILGGELSGYFDVDGQHIEDRSAVSAGVYSYVRLSDNWQWRPYIGVSYKFWADITEGKIIPLEFRYRNRWRFGLGVTIPIVGGGSIMPFGIISYDAGPALRERKAENDRKGRVAHIPEDQKVK
jgi:hypothetical protein